MRRTQGPGVLVFFFFQAEDGIRDWSVTGVQTCALPISLGARNVLIKGGHGGGDQSLDLLIGQGEVARLSARRIATSNLHGTGCTLSSAIAAGLAKGLDLRAAPQDAKKYVTDVIAPPDKL